MSDETEKLAALRAYWEARTPFQETAAILWMEQVGLGPAASEGYYPWAGCYGYEADTQQPKPAFITGDWSVEYPPIAEQPCERRDVFPRQAMR